MWKILILQRGWVIVGKAKKGGINGQEWIVEDGFVVRRWGTKDKGLGYLAENGPTPQTVLDKCSTMRAHELTVIMTIDCDAKAWGRV